MASVHIAGLTIFIILLFIGVYVTTFGLPGTILILGDVIFYGLATGFSKIGFKVIILLVLMTLIAETIGVATEMAGIRHVPSLRDIIASLVGAILGILLLTPVLMGLGTLLGIFFGGFAGFILIEMMTQNKLKPLFRAPMGAIIGTLTGNLAKGSLAIAMTIITLLNIYS